MDRVEPPREAERVELGVGAPDHRDAERVRFDDEIRVVIVRAEGRAFCAGVDLGMPEDRITGRSPAEKTRNYFERFRWVHERFACSPICRSP
jgi:enoyl-CoA hydratase/carnithine racemase